MNYIMVFVGLLIMACVPEEAGILRLILQAGFGLAIFGLGSLLILDEKNA